MGFERALTDYLIDYYSATTVLLLVLTFVRVCLRQPVRRMVLAWSTLISLGLLAVLCATPAWPRMTLRLWAESPPVSNIQAAPERTAKSPPTSTVQERPAGVLRVWPVLTPLARQRAAQKFTIESRAFSFPWPAKETLLAWGFLVGVMTVVTWETVGLLHVRRLQVSGQLAPDVALDEMRNLVAEGIRPPRLLVSPHVTVAVALGLWKPTIVLPQSAVVASEQSRLRLLLAHEWAHIRRGDLWLLALARLLLVVLLFQPLFWWLRRQIRDDQELLADASAAELCGRQTYAETLVIWSRQLPKLQPQVAGVIGIWESSGQLMRRIAMLLDEQFTVRTTTSRRWKWGTGLTTLLLVVGLSLVTLRPGPTAGAAEAPVKTDGPVVAQSPALANSPQPSMNGGAADQVAAKMLEVAGVCRDDQQKPLKDVRLLLVFLNYDEGKQLDLEEIRSDSEGRFRFAPVDANKLFSVPLSHHFRQPLNRTLFLIAQSKGRGTVTRAVGNVAPPLPVAPPGSSGIVTTAGDDATLALSGRMSVEVTLPPASSIRGRVVDEQGHPIIGAEVAVHQVTYRLLPGINNTVTDAEGRFEITDVAAWDKVAEEKSRHEKRVILTEDERKEHMRLGRGLVQHPDYPQKSFQFSKVPDVQDVTLTMPGSLEGQITFEETGKPAAKVKVEITRTTNDGTYFHDTKMTDAEGRYVFTAKLLPGAYRITATLDGWPLIVMNDVALKSGKNHIAMKMEAGGTIRIKAIEVGSGKPVGSTPESITLIQALHLATKVESGYAATNPDGTCQFRLRAGRTMLIAQTLTPSINSPHVSNHHSRWILAGNDRQAFHLVDVVKGETKQIELRLLRSSRFDDDEQGLQFNDEDEYRDQLTKLLDPNPKESSKVSEKKNLAELAAVAAIRELGGSIKTEIVDGLEFVVEVNMAYGEFNGEEVENKVFTDETLFYLQKLPRLKTLTLTRGQASDKGLNYLRGMEHLESVCLINTVGVTDAGIAPLATLPKLTWFCAHGVEQLTDESLRHLGQASNLQDVMIDGPRFTDAGFKHLQGLKHLQNLSLSVDSELVTDKSLQALSGQTEMESLLLGSSKITDLGLKHLHGMKQLSVLDLAKCGVTPGGLAELSKVLPKLKTQGGKKPHTGDHGSHD